MSPDAHGRWRQIEVAGDLRHGSPTSRISHTAPMLPPRVVEDSRKGWTSRDDRSLEVQPFSSIPGRPGTSLELEKVEAAGVEPASEDASERTSTRVGTLFEVSSSPAVTGLCAQQADFVSTSMRQRVRRSSLIVSVLRGYRRKLRELSLPGFIRQREQRRCYRSQLQVCPFLRGHGRHDARSERHHPRRNRYAPMSKTVTADAAT